MKTANENCEEVRTTVITFPVSTNEKATIKEAADKMGMKISSYCRYILIYEKKK